MCAQFGRREKYGLTSKEMKCVKIVLVPFPLISLTSKYEQGLFKFLNVLVPYNTAEICIDPVIAFLIFQLKVLYT